MTTMEEVICKAKDLAEAAGKKTGELVSLTKLKLELAETERAIAGVMEKIGRAIYATQKGEQMEDGVVEGYVAEADALQDKADDLAAQMDELRRTRHCCECGKNNPQEAAFCQNCGAKL